MQRRFIAIYLGVMNANGICHLLSSEEGPVIYDIILYYPAAVEFSAS